MVTREDASSSFSPKLEPLVIFFKEQFAYILVAPSVSQSFTIQIPMSYKYKDNKVVPWNYGCHTLDKEAPIVTNISGISGMTRSGRCYDPEASKASQIDEQHKIQIEKGKVKERLDLKENWADEPIIVKGSSSKKIVSDEEVFEVDPNRVSIK